MIVVTMAQCRMMYDDYVVEIDSTFSHHTNLLASFLASTNKRALKTPLNEWLN